ncbi:hypothetical protein ACFU5Y_30010 [Streptomyces gardneri]|uniref:hypothetical protein n=1 Tax=Streptomyces gardneri TaxID=66892 RepID=UPI0036788A7B
MLSPRVARSLEAAFEAFKKHGDGQGENLGHRARLEADARQVEADKGRLEADAGRLEGAFDVMASAGFKPYFLIALRELNPWGRAFSSYEGQTVLSTHDPVLTPGIPRGTPYLTVLGGSTPEWSAGDVLGKLAAEARVAGVPLREDPLARMLIAGGTELLWREVQKHHHLEQGEEFRIKCRETITSKGWFQKPKTRHAIYYRVAATEGGYTDHGSSWNDHNDSIGAGAKGATPSNVSYRSPGKSYDGVTDRARNPRGLPVDHDGLVVAISTLHLQAG